MNEFITSFLL